MSAPNPNPGAPWSESLQTLTRKVLEEGTSFHRSTGNVHLKHRDGHFGYLALDDLLARRWHIQPEPAGRVLQFATLDELLAAGWAVD
jgi:hypothetical protein